MASHFGLGFSFDGFLERVCFQNSKHLTTPLLRSIWNLSLTPLSSVCTNMIDMRMKQLLYYSGNYTTYQKTRGDAEVNQVSGISLHHSISHP
jgi:hypothetical protein